MNILVTAGATREYIDDVRYITNASSGRMGVEVALAAKKRGHNPILVCGLGVEAPDGITAMHVCSAQEMLLKVLELTGERGIQVVVSAAAVSDYTLKKREGKIKSKGELTLKLSPTKKILGEVREKYPEINLVGFKAESKATEKKLLDSARNAVREYELLFAVGNDLDDGVMGSPSINAVFVGLDWARYTGVSSKKNVAYEIIDLIESKYTI